MMQSPIYFTALVASVVGIWFVWDIGIRKLLLAAFRERLFKLRFELFTLGACGEISFDSEAYRAVETLICGLLRFAHRVTLMGFLLSLREQSQAKKTKEFVDYHQQIEQKISRTAPESQVKLRSILAETQKAVMLHVAFSYIAVLPILPVLRALNVVRLASKSKISDVLESDIYREESRRSAIVAA